MQLALDLATKGQFTTTPNPSVGCVLVKNNEIVGQGFHFKAGEPHAEVMALNHAGENAKGAVAYVTLEPCSHFGRTPPCARSLIKAGITKVIVAMQDPNPQVAGRGLSMLQASGIESAVGLLEEKAEILNKGFLKRMRTGKPFVQLKLAMSIDGKTAMASGESKWITCQAAREDVQQERAKACAILSTAQTVLADNPLLNVRWEQLPHSVQQEYQIENLRQPIRIILDRQHQINSNHRLFTIASPIWLISDTTRNMTALPEYCKHIQINITTKSYLETLMIELGKRHINHLWVEGGATLAGSLIKEKLVDELIVYIAPKLLGNQAKGLCDLPYLNKLADAPLWTLKSIEQIEDDVKLIYRYKTK
ncbi:bifunctional diaminohydroxyphosphoribosylaminopyrimidine deaminase/5-amino-6-(5-phosphoribosylamino)uracil reductase RibD [Seminibacterium arietis]|uniref:Riboflavin biosynthesis protein RibD n=1 Tax=Seminibacterium arietis TaxID=1173502 RepID=A0ABW3I8V3_9PAST